MAKVSPMMKASLTTKVPSPAKQGGHGSSDATTQKLLSKQNQDQQQLASQHRFTQYNLLAPRVQTQELSKKWHKM